MLTKDLCLARRRKLMELLKETPTGPLVLSDPINLRYLANFSVDPFSLGADFGGILVIENDGTAQLFHDHRLPKSVNEACVEQRTPIIWYDGKSAGQGPRRLILRETVVKFGGRIHDSLGDPACTRVLTTVGEMRRAKYADEIELLKKCMRLGEAGQAWARTHVKAGMSELQVYEGIFAATAEAARQPVIVYGDFTVSPGSSKRGGPPTDHILQDGETLILDYSCVLFGYRSDFTNTLVVGGKPTPAQQNLMDLSKAAMAAGEGMLKAGQSCKAVYDAVRGVFETAKLAGNFPHHAGHGLGLQHPEAPFFVEKADETLIAGDVVTLEPGLYVDNVGGVRIEHNYLITASGYERLSHHTIDLV
jgi:Xaa-Pro aminopeptidase